MNYIKKAREILDVEIANMQKSKDGLDSGFSDAVQLILDALNNKGKIVVTGIGKNLHIAEKLSATLASTGSTSVVLNPSQAMHGDLGIIAPNDIILALSFSGESDELIVLLPIIKRSNVKIIAMTGNKNSSLAKNCDAIIPILIEREACPFNLAPTCSTTATLAIGDALAIVLLEAKGFKKEDYAKLHPGGAIGRALLLRISDIMRSGDRIAVLSQTAKVKDAILAMTQARAGSAGIVDKDNRIIGIFTDGDLRRHLPNQPNLAEMKIVDIMTPHPITVNANQLAVDVLKIYEDNNIDDLIVTDDDQHIIGAVDIQDLPKLKII